MYFKKVSKTATKLSTVNQGKNLFLAEIHLLVHYLADME